MRLPIVFAAIALGSISTAGHGRMIIVLTDPMTMDRRTVVIDTPGPDRAYICMRPPGDAGCRQIPVKRARP